MVSQAFANCLSPAPRLRYAFRFVGADADNSLVVSNPSPRTGVVRLLSAPQGEPKVIKVAAGRTVALTASQLGWNSGTRTVIKMSPGVQPSLRSNSNLIRLPQVDGVHAYEVFSEDLRGEVMSVGGERSVIAMAASRISAAYDPTFAYNGGVLPQVAAVDQAAQQVADIAVGQTRTGNLEVSDDRSRLNEFRYADNYRLTLGSAQTVRIVMKSATFDSYLAVFNGSAAMLGENDDGDDDSDSRDSLLELTLARGVYIIEASSYHPREGGPYTLSVNTLGPAKPTIELSAGQSVKGLLESSDNRSFLGDGSFADYYELNVTSAQSLTITLRSDDFDAYLAVADLARGEVNDDDDGAGDTDAEVAMMFQPGAYFLEANSYDPGEHGAYTLWVSAPATPSPTITMEGVVSSAGFIGGSVAPGEILSFFGTDIGPNQLAGLEFGSDGLVLTEIGGTRILFDGKPAPMVFSITNQASAVAPYALARVGRTSTEVEIEKDGRRTRAIRLPISAAKPSIFSINQSGTGPGAVLNQDFSLNSAANPAKRGAAIQIFLTGGGQTSPASADGELAPSSLPLAELVAEVSVTIGGRPAPVLYKGGAPGLINGLVQVNVLIDEATPIGDAVELIVTVGGLPSQAGITVSVE